jgi:hypothetical protein
MLSKSMAFWLVKIVRLSCSRHHERSVLFLFSDKASLFLLSELFSEEVHLPTGVIEVVLELILGLLDSLLGLS